MCGIAGVADFSGAPVERDAIERMCAQIAVRGPDDAGVFLGPGIGLGHRRLAITDLVTGRQPLGNEDGTVQVVLNGEVYNYQALRAELEARGHRFATATDTEVIVHLYEELGPQYVRRLEGTWAIGLWDAERRRLVLSRDRLGKRPLVWHASGGVVRFASEPKALLADPAVPRDVSEQALRDVIWHGHVVEDRTMWSAIQTVKPATTLVFEDGRLVSAEEHWDFAEVEPFAGSLEDGIAAFTDVFAEVTHERLMGDASHGLLLSGGIDSALVASFVAEREPGVHAYTIARGGSDDESEEAAAIARHVGAEHHVVPIAADDPAEIAARIPWIFDQPFYNDAAIANTLLARAMGGQVTVAITGDGGDNTFGGAWRHIGDSGARSLARAPRSVVAASAAAGEAGQRLTSSRIARRVSKGLRAAQVEDRRRWLSIRQHDLPVRHRALLSRPLWETNGADPDAPAPELYDRCTSPDHLNRLLYAELRFELPPNDLMKVDRTFMRSALMGRSPFLDRRVVELAASMPAEWKQRGRTFKQLLREVARRRLPADVAERPKTGLQVPFREWLRGPLGEKVGGLLGSDSFAARGVFDRAGALVALDRHRRGRGDYGYALWTMAMTELWFRCMVDTFAEPDERIWE
jgi:asparagine synthase (glutamine-hydrolysing)